MADLLYSSVSVPSEAKKPRSRSCLGSANKLALLNRPSDRCGKTLRGVCDCVARGDAIPFATLPPSAPPSLPQTFSFFLLRSGKEQRTHANACFFTAPSRHLVARPQWLGFPSPQMEAITAL